MRRHDREVTDHGEKLAIMQRCDVCRLAFFDVEAPYIVPMNFGFEVQNGTLLLYFHCAKAGKKLDLLMENPQVAFEMDDAHRLLEGETACGYSMAYESVTGGGVAEVVGGAGKLHALQCIMRHYRPDRQFSFEPRMLESVTVFQIRVQKLTAKRRPAL